MAFHKISKELKDKAVERYIDCQSLRTVAKEFNVSSASVSQWVKDAGLSPIKESKVADVLSPAKQEKPQINALLLNMAQGNDLTPFVGKDITKMQPREIFKFLELLNIEGTLTIKQKVRLK